MCLCAHVCMCWSGVVPVDFLAPVTSDMKSIMVTYPERLLPPTPSVYLYILSPDCSFRSSPSHMHTEDSRLIFFLFLSLACLYEGRSTCSYSRLLTRSAPLTQAGSIYRKSWIRSPTRFALCLRHCVLCLRTGMSSSQREI